jgi:hypothetical protein
MTLSSSVQEAQDRLGLTRPVAAAEFAAVILNLHPEYGQDIGGRVAQELRPAPNARQEPPGRWIEEVCDLFEPQLVGRLHGRAVVVGLSLLDRSLADQLRPSRLLEAIAGEMTPPLERTLSEQGAVLWRVLRDPTPPDPATPDPARLPEKAAGTVPRSDRPTDEDQLGRQVFAEALATMLEHLYDDDLQPKPDQRRAEAARRSAERGKSPASRASCACCPTCSRGASRVGRASCGGCSTC